MRKVAAAFGKDSPTLRFPLKTSKLASMNCEKILRQFSSVLFTTGTNDLVDKRWADLQN